MMNSDLTFVFCHTTAVPESRQNDWRVFDGLEK